VSRGGAPHEQRRKRERALEQERNRRFVELARAQGCICTPWITSRLKPGESGRIAVAHDDWCPLCENADAESLVVTDRAGLPLAALVNEASLRRPERN
jgi:hypothetical protein